jgi:hypothetical protein
MSWARLGARNSLSINPSNFELFNPGGQSFNFHFMIKGKGSPNPNSQLCIVHTTKYIIYFPLLVAIFVVVSKRLWESSVYIWPKGPGLLVKVARDRTAAGIREKADAPENIGNSSVSYATDVNRILTLLKMKASLRVICFRFNTSLFLQTKTFQSLWLGHVRKLGTLRICSLSLQLESFSRRDLGLERRQRRRHVTSQDELDISWCKERLGIGWEWEAGALLKEDVQRRHLHNQPKGKLRQQVEKSRGDTPAWPSVPKWVSHERDCKTFRVEFNFAFSLARIRDIIHKNVCHMRGNKFTYRVSYVSA